MQDMDTLHQRLLKSFEYLKNKGLVHTQTQFAEILGKPQQNINGAFKDAPKRCTLGLMTRIADAFPDVLNRDYLLTGTGSPAAPDRSLRPHFSAKASAGFMVEVSQGEAGTMLPPIPGMPDYDFTIEAQGDSMLPRIESGDILVCRRSLDRADPPLGRICVIDSRDGAAVKEIADASDEAVTLRSLNPDYPDYSVDVSDILAIAEVVAIVRRF